MEDVFDSPDYPVSNWWKSFKYRQYWKTLFSEAEPPIYPVKHGILTTGVLRFISKGYIDWGSLAGPCGYPSILRMLPWACWFWSFGAWKYGPSYFDNPWNDHKYPYHTIHHKSIADKSIFNVGNPPTQYCWYTFIHLPAYHRLRPALAGLLHCVEPYVILRLELLMDIFP